MSGFKDLSLFDLGLAAMLIVVNGALSVALNLGLERKLLIAAVRTVVQLLLIGYVLGWVFAFNRWYVVLPLMALMTVIAGLAASDRGRRTYAGPARGQHRVDLGQFVADRRVRAVRRDPHSPVVRAAVRDSDPRHDPRQ